MRCWRESQSEPWALSMRRIDQCTRISHCPPLSVAHTSSHIPLTLLVAPNHHQHPTKTISINQKNRKFAKRKQNQTHRKTTAPKPWRLLSKENGPSHRNRGTTESNHQEQSRAARTHQEEQKNRWKDSKLKQLWMKTVPTGQLQRLAIIERARKKA